MDQALSQIVSSITNQWDRNAFQISIKEVLLTKRKRVSDEEAYFDSLCGNVTYLTESTHPIKEIIGDCLNKNILWNSQDAESVIDNYQSSIKQEMSTLSQNYKKELRKNSLSESVNEAEFAYAYSRVKFDIEYLFLHAFLDPENRSLMEPFFNLEPIQFISMIDKQSDFYTNLFLQNIRFTVPNNAEITEITEATKEEINHEKKKKGFFSRLFG